MKRFVVYICAAALLVGIVPTVHAQSSLGNALEPVKFIFAPEVPGPRQTMTIEAQGIGTFLGDASITWRLNGKVALTGVGERVFSFTTGDLGVQSRVDITIVSNTKGTISKSFVFIPSVINLLWEADTTVPPLFMGKPLYSAGSRLTVTAFPTVIGNGKTISSNNFSFQWSRNGSKVTDQSGLGRSSFAFNGDQLRDYENISVDVYLDSVLVGRGSITIPTTKPRVVLYYRDPLLGVQYERAVTSPFALASTEATLQAQPYYFSNASAANNALQFAWTINNKEVTGPNTAQGLITLRKTGTGEGTNTVGVELQNVDTDTFIQAAKTAVRVVFGQDNNSILPSIFGL